MFANSSCHMNGAETSSFLGFVVVLGRPLETCYIRRGYAVERWCGTEQRDRLMPLSAVGPPSRNAGAAVLPHCTTPGPHGPLPCAPNAGVSRFLHFAHASNLLGSPWFYTTFEDESQNRRLAMIAAGAQGAVVSKGVAVVAPRIW